MEILEIKNKDQWNKFVAENGSQFLQSWDWGEFQKSLSRKIWHLAVVKGEDILAGALVIKYNLPLGQSYLYIPRGPVGRHEAGSMKHALSRTEGYELFDKIKEIVKKEKSIFIRIEPVTRKMDDFCSMFNVQCSMFNETKPVQPKDEWKLDLTPSEEELLKNMHPKTRYNIGLAERHGVTARKAGKDGLEKFWQLIEETYGKKGLRAHPKEYYKKMLDLPSAELYFVEYHGLVLAANLMVFFGDTAYYLHGASSEKHKEVMAPYFLFWETIKEAKKRGFKYYNFGGIAPEGSDEKHPWFGITRFKHGFGGEEVNYAGTWDLPVSRFWYTIYKIGKFVTNITRIGRE